MDITYKSVIENLNILDHDYYFKITTSILEQDISNTLLIFNEIIENGFDGHHFIGGLAAHFRDLLVSKDEETLVLLEKGGIIKRAIPYSIKVLRASTFAKSIGSLQPM